MGYVIIYLGIFPGFWISGIRGPDRALNVSFWVFVFMWFNIMLWLGTFLREKLNSFESNKTINFLGLSAVLMVFLVSENQNYSVAIEDLFSGSASKYNEEFIEREKIIESCNDSICEVESFKNYPKTLFNEDIGSDENNLLNSLYASYYEIGKIKVKFIPPENSYNCNFTFDKSENFVSPQYISNEKYYSGSSSLKLTKENSYTLSFSSKMKDLNFPNVKRIRGVNISAMMNSAFPNVDMRINFAIINPLKENQTVTWQSKPFIANDFDSNTWFLADFSPSIIDEYLEPENNITIHLSCAPENIVYVDDLKICFY